ncbi:Histidinol dehydrogenase, chloroplastic [Porphyridium purpureum]|uniref:histidinol dehydrogenase n=1 Tax=Porphyridium purpureum TaxID=35688 RepID=A0A5J4Z6V2_PORPP|nr:Histidinol dehydrogenase, chloroplastic [Porphyridium purpureum]|eukprot:POR9844..scf295_1
MYCPHCTSLSEPRVYSAHDSVLRESSLAAAVERWDRWREEARGDMMAFVVGGSASVQRVPGWACKRGLSASARRGFLAPSGRSRQLSTKWSMVLVEPQPAPGAAAAPDAVAELPFGMKVYEMHALSPEQVKYLTLRPKIDFEGVMSIVKPIVQDVKSKGNAAVLEYTRKFDKVEMAAADLVVDPRTLPWPSASEMSAASKQAVDVAYENIYKFHEAQKRAEIRVETMPGIECIRVARPIERVGIYVPGGTAVLPSTALMLGVPAQIAGCTEIVLATPPRADGSICPEVLYAAKKCGVTRILKAGGAQAVAAMAYGTESVPKVDKICGPGNQFVTSAKMLLQNSGEAMVAIDMPAGPSEQLCIADASANPAFVVSDLLSQAEHGKDSQVVAVVLPGFDLEAMERELVQQMQVLPRSEFAKIAISKSLVVKVRDVDEALKFTNEYAPEHLCIPSDDCDKYVAGIINAGSVFLGPYTPESVGDYASGTNHSLPTYGYARMYGGVSLDTFVKYITMQKLSAQGIQNVGPHVEVMAAVEELDAHKNAVTIRLNALKQE